MRPSRPRILVGRCLSYGDGIAYWPLAEILNSLAGIADDDPAATALAQIAALVDDALPGASPEQRGMTTAALAFTLGLDSGDQEFSRLQPSAIRVELHRAWRTILSALAARGAARRGGRGHPLGRPGAARPARGDRRARPGAGCSSSARRAPT